MELGSRFKSRLRDWTRIENEGHKSPTEAIIDSESVKIASMVHQEVGYDAGKQIKSWIRFEKRDSTNFTKRYIVCFFCIDLLKFYPSTASM